MWTIHKLPLQWMKLLCKVFPAIINWYSLTVSQSRSFFLKLFHSGVSSEQQEEYNLKWFHKLKQSFIPFILAFIIEANVSMCRWIDNKIVIHIQLLHFKKVGKLLHALIMVSLDTIMLNKINKLQSYKNNSNESTYVTFPLLSNFETQNVR